MTAPRMRRCELCGSVFRGHVCHMLPEWIARMITHSRARREAAMNAPPPAVGSAPGDAPASTPGAATMTDLHLPAT